MQEFWWYSFNVECKANHYNRRVYSLISVPQITRLLSGDPAISSKTDARSGSKKEKRIYGKIRNNKIISTILSFIWILKQQSNILQRYIQTTARGSCRCHKLRLFKSVETCKRLSPFNELQGLEMYYTMIWTTTTSEYTIKT